MKNENGTIVPAKDTEDLKKAMERMLSDSDYYYKLKNNSRPMIESRYEQSVVWNALLGEYKKLIKEKNFCE